MALDIAAIRDGVKTRLATVSGLRAFDTIPMEIVPPAAVVEIASINYHEAFKKGLAIVRVRIILITSRASDRTGQDKLDAYLSAGTGMTSSVVDALEGDATLGGNADHSAVLDEDINYGIAEISGNTYWKADLHLQVLRARS